MNKKPAKMLMQIQFEVFMQKVDKVFIGFYIKLGGFCEKKVICKEERK
jgi:hypothetical protein